MGIYVKFGEETYHIQFHHGKASDSEAVIQQQDKKGYIKHVRVQLPRPCTCNIYKFESENVKVPITAGISVCSHLEPYVKSKGRIVSFARALFDSSVPEELKTVLENGYFSRTNDSEKILNDIETYNDTVQHLKQVKDERKKQQSK